MIIFLYGKDGFRARQQLRRMKAKFLSDRDPQGLNCDVIHASSAKEGEIMMQIGAAPFLAEKRMVVIDSLFSTKQYDVAEALSDMIKEGKMPSSTVLVVIDELDAVKKKEFKVLYDLLVAEKYSQRFDLLTGSKLLGWIAAEVSVRGGTITQEAARSLGSAIPADMWQLHNTIDQLIAHAGDRDIRAEDITLFVDKPVDDNIFTLVDAIVKKQGNNVFSLIEKQYQEGKDPGYIFAMLLRQFRIMFQIADMQARKEGLPPAETAKALGIHPFVVKKTLPLLKHYSRGQLQQIHDELLSIDAQTKTGQAAQAVLIDRFVGTCCS